MTPLEIEEMAADGWPAGEVEVLCGWRLRFTHGVTRRANSVWPNQLEPTANVDDLIARVERFYTARKQPARFQISPAAQPADLDHRLAERGYKIVSRTAVQVAELAMRTNPRNSAMPLAIRISPTVDDEWFQAYCAAERVEDDAAPIRRAILQRIPAQTAYALASVDGEAVALGSAVLIGGWLGVFNMATLATFRRRGAATTLLDGLINWGRDLGARQAFLQVMADNQAAAKLYAAAGFATRYHYHYRETKLD